MRNVLFKRVFGALAVVCLIILLFCSARVPGYEVEVLSIEYPNEYDLIYDDLSHRIIVCCPDEIDENTDVIIMLHGYGSTASDFQRITGFDEAAVPRNHLVVYITGAPEKNDPTSSYGWNASWNSGLRESDKDDVGLLVATVKYIQSAYGLSSPHAFAVGFSNGGFMTYRLATEASDTFTACASVAGKMPYSLWEHRDNKKTSGMLQINGTADDVVPMRDRMGDTALNTETPVIEDVIEYLAAVNGCDQIWYVVIPHGTHCWPDYEMAGFDVNELILDYFEEYAPKNF